MPYPAAVAAAIVTCFVMRSSSSPLGSRLQSPCRHQGGERELPRKFPLLLAEPLRECRHPALAAAIRDGKRTFEEAGGARAYFGWPAEATADEGRASVATLGDILAEAAIAVIAPGRAA